MRTPIVVAICFAMCIYVVYPLDCYVCSESDDETKVWGGPCFNVTGDTLIGNKSAETKVDCNTCYVGGRQLENGSYYIKRDCWIQDIPSIKKCGNETIELDSEDMSCKCATEGCNDVPVGLLISPPTTTASTTDQGHEDPFESIICNGTDRLLEN